MASCSCPISQVKAKKYHLAAAETMVWVGNSLGKPCHHKNLGGILKKTSHIKVNLTEWVFNFSRTFGGYQFLTGCLGQVLHPQVINNECSLIKCKMLLLCALYYVHLLCSPPVART